MTPRKTRQNAVVIPLENEEEKEDDRSPEERESESTVTEALSAVPSTTMARLYRIDPGTGREGYLGSVDAKAFNVDFVRENYGGGDYRVEFRGPTGKGRVKGYKGGDSFTIDKAIPRKYPREPNAENGTAAPAMPSGSGMMDQLVMTTFMTMLQNMAAQQREHSTGMTALMTKLAAPQERDPVITLLLTKMLEKSADPIEQAARIAEINAKGAARGTTSEVLATIELVEKIKALGGGEGGGRDEHWVAAIAREFAPHLLGRSQQPEPAPPAHQPPPPAPSGASPVPFTGPVQTPPPNLPADLAPFAPHLPFLLNAARGGMTPTLIADLLIESVSDQEALAALLARPGLVPDILAAEPALIQYTQWLDAVRAEALQSLTGPDDDDESPEEQA